MPAPVTRHHLGFAVKVLAEGGLPSHDARRWQSGPHLRVSLDHVRAILEFLDEHDIRMYRLTAGLAPYATHPELPAFHDQVAECAEQLAAAGARARELGIRLSSHPGQYTVLNSVREEVRAAAAAELELQAALLDAMAQGPEAVVVVHIGGAEGGIAAGAARFEAGLELLGDRARARLVIENDDRSYALGDVLQISARTGIPVVWDALHHRCLDPEAIPDHEALSAALDTWPAGVVPKIHYSSPRLDVTERTRKAGRRVEHRLVMPQLRAHADTIDPIGFENLLRYAAGDRDFDVLLEAKAKDLALLRLREQLAARGWPTERGAVVVSRETARGSREAQLTARSASTSCG